MMLGIFVIVLQYAMYIVFVYKDLTFNFCKYMYNNLKHIIDVSWFLSIHYGPI